MKCIQACARKPAARKRFEHVMRVGPKEFSWFIYRVTNPTLRDLFMSPSERMGMKKALLSVLAGAVALVAATPVAVAASGVFLGLLLGAALRLLQRSPTPWWPPAGGARRRPA